MKAEARAFDAWSGGTCFDTSNASANEPGPVSSALREQSYSTTTLGVPNALHETSFATWWRRTGCKPRVARKLTFPSKTPAAAESHRNEKTATPETELNVPPQQRTSMMDV